MESKSLTKEQEQQLIEHYTTGMSYKRLGELFNIGSTTARLIVVKSGVKRREWYNSNTGCKPIDVDLVIKTYEETRSMEKTASILGLDYGLINRTLHKNNVQIDPVGGKRKLGDRLEARVCKLYRNGATMRELGHLYEVDDTTILGILRRNGEVTRPTKENQYHIIEDFFDDINTEEKAYFLGMLYADGNVARDQPTICLSLQEDDGYLVEQLNSFVSNDRPLYLKSDNDNESSRPQYNLVMYSQHMKDTLVSYGMVPAKSLILQFPQVITDAPEHIQRHCIRGWFDGDGHVSIYKRKDKRNENSPQNYKHNVSIVGTLDAMTGIRCIIEKYIPDISFHIYKKDKSNDKNTYILMVQGGFNAGKFLKWLYTDATIYMNRKHFVAKQIIQKYT
jgi:hypothetical protein